MRISDWSSDVCSSDLLRKALMVFHAPRDATVGIDNATRIFVAAKHPKSFVSLDDADHLLRSEEHTSELQSLMRISYAVFCLKTNNEALQKHLIGQIYNSRHNNSHTETRIRASDIHH